MASFPLLAFHAQTTGLLTDAQVPLVFALAMFVDGASGLVMDRMYDSWGPRTLLAVPVAAAASAIAFAGDVALVWLGVAIWGVVNGVMDSTVKAVVTELVPSSTRPVAFGWLAFARGAGLLIAGGVLGAVYDVGSGWTIVAIVAANIAGFAGLLLTLRRTRSAA
ncbi:MFS transporter [Microbacterium bovistercoris]|uniref:MFS transporter n=1 Tax=Microbacterium bovistercoris TaxID=2293570 RepID=UPI001C6F49E5|nr:MFS transporter [Microbacterium bovistercoris]